jgi:predicted dehydrogenase
VTLEQRTLALGFAGLGWIGRRRMQAMVADAGVRAAAVADPDPELRDAAIRDAPGAVAAISLEELLELDLDGIVIATPSALHAEQAVAALERGVPVFCQKPLGRDAREAAHVVAAARAADRLLDVDLSYRHTTAAQRVKETVDTGELGRIYAAELVFHNAYGPDKPWFRDRELAGGGCLIDLGTHLVDLALWLLGSDEVEVLGGHVLHDGRPLPAGSNEVEDYALAELSLDGAVIARLACSWWLPAGRDCVFEVALYGTEAAVAMRNVGGSFYDFEAVLQRDTAATTLAAPPDGWGGRAALAWTRRLADDRSFDPSAEKLVRLSGVLDEIYRAAA